MTSGRGQVLQALSFAESAHFAFFWFNLRVSSSLSSSPSLHSIPSSPTAKIVSPSSDSLGRVDSGGCCGALLVFCGRVLDACCRFGAVLMASARDVDAPPEGGTDRSVSLRACSSSSDSESAILRISNPSSSCASCEDQFSACYVIRPINRTLTSSLIAKRRLLAVGRQR